MGEVFDDEQDNAVVICVVHQLDVGGAIVHRVCEHTMDEHKLGIGRDHSHDLLHLLVNSVLSRRLGFGGGRFVRGDTFAELLGHLSLLFFRHKSVDAVTNLLRI